MNNILNSLLLLTLVFSLNLSAKKQEAVNHLELASLMLKDGNLDRAEITLSKVDTKDETLDMQRFYIISALLNIKQNNAVNAIELIKKAKKIGKVDAVVNVHLAQSAYAVEDYPLVLEALSDAGPSIAKIPSIYLLRAQSYWNLKNNNMALAELDQAGEIFPKNKSFPRRKIFYYIQLGYNKQAASLGTAYLDKFKGESKDYVAIGTALYTSGDNLTALQFLETAKLKFPQDENTAKSLAAVYIQNEMYFSAAKIIHDASFNNPNLIKEAAELYRRAGSEYMALSLNGLILDQTGKLKQRMALMLQLENFEQAAGMENSLKRLQLDEDENIKYALAYSFFKIGSYSKAKDYLSKITDTDIFKKAVELRKIMADCQLEPWHCQ